MDKITFSRSHTQILKGIALILMIIHHTTIKNYWSGEDLPLYNYLNFQEHSTKMCVWIFAFLVGYGFYCSKNKTLKYSLKRILLLVIPFWVMLFGMFIPSAYLTNGGGNLLSVKEIALNMFGLSESLNWYSWFMGFYCFSILMLPGLHLLFQKFKRFGWLAAIFGYYAFAIGLHSIPNWDTMPMVHMLFTTCTLIPLIIVGYMCALWNSEGKIPNWFEGKSRLPLAIVTIVIVMLINGIQIETKGFCIPAFYTPFLIFAVVGIFNSFELKWLRQGLTKVGDLSMYMWFFHAIFFTTSVNLYTRNLVFEPIHNYFYTLIMTFVLTYCGSWVIKKLVTPIINRIK